MSALDKALVSGWVYFGMVDVVWVSKAATKS
jgi:hypothetical protein